MSQEAGAGTGWIRQDSNSFTRLSLCYITSQEPQTLSAAIVFLRQNLTSIQTSDSDV